MREVSASEIAAGDIGSRVIVIDATGNAYAGILTDAGATTWKYGERPEDKVRIRLKVSSDEASALHLTDLPLDFRLQIERGSTDRAGAVADA